MMQKVLFDKKGSLLYFAQLFHVLSTKLCGAIHRSMIPVFWWPHLGNQKWMTTQEGFDDITQQVNRINQKLQLTYQNYKWWHIYNKHSFHTKYPMDNMNWIGMTNKPQHTLNSTDWQKSKETEASIVKSLHKKSHWDRRGSTFQT